MQQNPNRLYEFGEFRLEPSQRRLCRGKEHVALSPKVFDLLVVLVENRGRIVTKDEMLKLVWPDSFVEEANLSVHVSALRKALGEDPGRVRFIETVAKRGYRFTDEVVVSVPSATVPPVEVQATHETLAQPASPARAWPIRKGIVLGITVILLALAGLAYRVGGRRQDSNIRTIAVLPFLVLSSEGTQNYLGPGMADALITRLSRIEQLTVRPTSAILRYANYQGDRAGAARELKVDALLEGSVQQAEGHLRTTVRLIRPADGKVLWGDRFDDLWTNVFLVQDSISEKVATALAMRLTAPEVREMKKHSTANMEAYELYIQGQYLASRRTAPERRTALEYFEKAVRLDPDYAMAYAALARSSVILSSHGWEPELRQRAKVAASRALFLDDKLPEAHVALGEVLFRSEWDWEGAMREFDRALALNPNLPDAHALRSLWLTATGRHPEAIQEMETASRLNPGSADVRSDVAWTFYSAREYGKELREALVAVRMDPESFSAHQELDRAYSFNSRYDEALKECARMDEIAVNQWRRMSGEKAVVYALAGRRAEAAAALARARSPAFHDPIPYYQMATAEAILGDADAAFRDLSEAVAKKNATAIWMKTDPALDGLHADARFVRILARAGLSR